MALQAELDFDPWQQDEGDKLSEADQSRLRLLGGANCRRVGDGCALLEQQAQLLIRWIIHGEQGDGLAEPFRTWSRKDPCLQNLHDDLWPRLNGCASAEKEAFLRGIQGAAHRCGTLRCTESWSPRCVAHRPQFLFRRSAGLAHGSRLGPGATLGGAVAGSPSAGAGGTAAPSGVIGLGNSNDAQWRRRYCPASGPDRCSTGLGRPHPKDGGPGGDSSPFAGSTAGGCGAAHLRAVSRRLPPVGGLGASGPVDGGGP